MTGKKHIVIIGLGGVGGYFGFRISRFSEKNNLHKISFVARGETFDTLKNNGLTLISSEHQNNITKPDFVASKIKEIIEPDLVLICVKEYDLENVCNQLSEVITNSTILLPMMNGADIYDRIRKIIPNNIILPSCIYVASHIKQKGVIEHKGKTGKLIFGKDPQNTSKNIDWVLNLMQNCNIDFDYKNDALIDIWTKFIFISSIGLVTTKYNSSIGKVCVDKLQKEEVTHIMREIKEIANSKGIKLPKNIIEITFDKASTFPPKTPTSLQLDIHSGKSKNELELFAGAVIKYGRELNIKTPFTENIYNEIKAKHIV
ncbi:ketopantoate reductase family protein [Belliella marina]|uniref:2-dehydropantoate 2-reductase n=1 Tax=Belliella marina TaxID=1644146 RepID=A0ABW4VL66_9BACT